jgi:tetratricopeptide (TPR) repeat protein
MCIRDRIKQLIASDFPVIIETGYMPEGYDWIGHYQTVVGYDDVQRVFYIYDSYLGTGEGGAGIAEPYDEMDYNWSHFNRTFIVLYRQEEENKVRELLGDWADPQRAAQIAAETAQAEAASNPNNGFAWFNLGSSLTRLERYTEAASAFDQARRVGVPWRMTLYQFGPFEAYFNDGRLADVTALVNTNLNNGGQFVEETHYWKGRVLAAQGQRQQAASSFRLALSQNPRFSAAAEALRQLNL